MKMNAPLYILTSALLGVSVYLHSPMIAVAIVALWGVAAAEVVLTKQTREADLVAIMETLKQHQVKMGTLAKDITNVAERARTILGENY